MKLLFLLSLLISSLATAESPWLNNLNSDEKQQQMQLRWKAVGGQADLKFIYNKLSALDIKVSPKPEFANKHWDYNHLVFPISENSNLELLMPYGNIEKVTAGFLNIDSNFILSSNTKSHKVSSFKLIPTKKPLNQSDIITFKFVDQADNHLFTIDSVHIEFDKTKKLLLMQNMDLFATQELANLLESPMLADQVVGQLHTYNQLEIPEAAMTEMKAGSCVNHPIWPPAGNVDVALIDIGSVQWMRNIGTDKIVVAPSARLKNVGTADVPWHPQFSAPEPPYGTDQHPFLNWSMYREVNGRFEQLGNSGVKHAFLTINSNCTINCNDNNILWLGCEDVYGTGNNDSSFALGPRAEIEAFAGTWDNCGSFFDPEPCTGSHQNSSNGPDQNRLSVYNEDLLDPDNTGVYMQAWYLIRDDINIFNSMGYKLLNPSQVNTSWSMNPSNTFVNKPALDSYVPTNTSSATQASQTIATNEGHFTVAVKVFDLGGGLYRYNYAVENYDFDPKFDKFKIPLSTNALLTDTVFVDPERDDSNNWNFETNAGYLEITGNANNQQDWGMLFSFSFTTDSAPELNSFEINVANPILNQTVSAVVLIPMKSDLIYKNSFEI
jgi:hypothetical protein